MKKKAINGVLVIILILSLFYLLLSYAQPELALRRIWGFLVFFAGLGLLRRDKKETEVKKE